MSIKALFFDIDGTLVSFETHTIPQSTVHALEEASKRGIKIIISTGRPPLFINNLAPIEHLIDGYITSNGAYSFIGNRRISLTPIQRSDVDAVLEMCSTLDVPCIVVGRDMVDTYNYKPVAEEIFGSLLAIHNTGKGDNIDKVLEGPVLQMTPIVSLEQEQTMRGALQNVEAERWCELFMDITARGISKAHGIEVMAKEFGFDISETMAFGDGGNDASMLRTAGIGVAMGNAGDKAKDAADYITTSVDDNGVLEALRRFEVI